MSYYITTSISYVNGQPHLGHAYEAIATDALARHMRQRGEDVFFLTGTDEHGEPVADAAHALGIEPQELADRNAERFKALMPQLEVSNDFFIRTTDPQHKAKVQEVLQRVHDNGYVYKGLYEGWYCPRCADFKAENEILPGNRCPIHEIALTRESEENWFFRLSAFQERLEQHFADNPDFVMPARAFNEAHAFVTQGLQDISLSRGKLKWGVTVPWDETHVFYVWFDALLNYYTALSYARPGEDLTDRFWPANFHIVGKDIVKFHSIYWPALLWAAGIEPPQHVFVHGFLLGSDGRKMSKSLGNVLDPFEVLDEFGAEALRFYLLREVAFGSDGPVGNEALVKRYETELANDYGNLASRTLAMVVRYRDGKIPSATIDPEIRSEFEGLDDEVAALFDRVEITAALDLIWQRVRRLNRYVEEKAPWQLAKDPERADALNQVLTTLVEGVRVLTVLLHPVLPISTEKLSAAIIPSNLSYDRAHLPLSRTGGHVETIPPLFPQARMIDSHTHLNVCEPPDSDLVKAALQVGVTKMLTVGTEVASSRKALQAAEEFPEVFAAIGIHPNSATGFDDSDFAELEALAAHPLCLAIGETGLDYYRANAPHEDQRRAFLAQIELSRSTRKPLVIHTRGADEDTLAILNEHAADIKVILHCFSMGDRIVECLEHENWWISFAGNSTYPANAQLREAAIRVPASRLLVETDAPYLSPQPMRGKPNTPANVVTTAEIIALERRVSYHEFDREVEAAAEAVFGW